MIASLILALATVGDADPVAGSPLYTPAIGDKAVLHNYNVIRGTVHPDVEVWTNTTALSKFVEGIQSDANQRERTKVLGNPEELHALFSRQRDALLKEPKKRGEVLSLPDMTPVRVRVLAKFYKFDKPNALLGEIVPDNILVEVTDGPAKGRFFWAPRFAVRVPGAQAPKLEGFNFAADPPEDKPASPPEPSPSAAPSPPAAKLLVGKQLLETDSTDFVQVHCRVRNISDQPLESVTANRRIRKPLPGILSIPAA